MGCKAGSEAQGLEELKTEIFGRCERNEGMPDERAKELCYDLSRQFNDAKPDMCDGARRIMLDGKFRVLYSEQPLSVPGATGQLKLYCFNALNVNPEDLQVTVEEVRQFVGPQSSEDRPTSYDTEIRFSFNAPDRPSETLRGSLTNRADYSFAESNEEMDCLRQSVTFKSVEVEPDPSTDLSLWEPVFSSNPTYDPSIGFAWASIPSTPSGHIDVIYADRFHRISVGHRNTLIIATRDSS